MKKIKKYFLPISLFISVLLVLGLILIAHRPARYAPVKIADQNQVSPYLTNQILPKIYNGAQIGRPFEVEITQEGLNDILARFQQPLKLQNITLADPQVILLPKQIIVMATVRTAPLDLFAAVELNPSINKQGLLNLHVNNVSLGLVNITTLAISAGTRAYSNWLSSTGIEPNNIAAQVCRSLLSDEPFEPTFEIGDKKLRISNIALADKRVTIQLTPLSEQDEAAATPQLSHR